MSLNSENPLVKDFFIKILEKSIDEVCKSEEFEKLIKGITEEFENVLLEYLKGNFIEYTDGLTYEYEERLEEYLYKDANLVKIFKIKLAAINQMVDEKLNK